MKVKKKININKITLAYKNKINPKFNNVSLDDVILVGRVLLYFYYKELEKKEN